MMNMATRSSAQQSGVALATSLLFLLVVTLIALTAANNSTLGLKMSANMQDSYRSFQAAEAGIYAALGLAGTTEDPFIRGDVVSEPFTDVAEHPLRNLGANPDTLVDVDVHLIAVERTCPRPARSSGGSSVDVFDCDYYRIESEHDQPGRARSRVEMGVVKTVIGSGG